MTWEIKLPLKLPEPIAFDEGSLKEILDNVLGKFVDGPIDKYIGLDPPKKKEVVDSLVANLQDLQSQIPDSREVLEAAVQGITQARITGKETGTYSNEGAAIGCVVGATIGAAFGGLAGAAFGCMAGGPIGRALGERKEFRKAVTRPMAAPHKLA
ncbi:hypothetical protein U8P73_36660 (plasmid) [Rhizobium beringeri]|uniref:hypothetical protein n=1 Tax=Rhizobium beringeri TaxID=3019934 RepID=UPI002DDCD473|nr:hypothetical protein [Rhizobium beringeri]WSG93505.1 hypothetical protein U8P73_36660 [Rhizobium beringeri]